ncbi:MAG: serine/threonine protein kinase [Muribaculaceae bacterium]|nr:serine/threonine protein kinase [Muribaculaceae bacterium]
MGQTLKNGSLLQGGRYKILGLLGQGGFGITYLAVQSGLDRTVAIKEFFMKEMCSRDESTSHVTLGTEGARDTVERFREKFLKEARNIARFKHPNIVRIYDIFEENGTAYYVMEYAECGSLSDKVKREGPISEPQATRYIKQIASALDYIHRQNMNHLDVKPGNVMLNAKDETVLIDFGLAKQYDAKTGSQTSTTPVGISEGYAPMEQYKQGGVGSFSPETDVYALGATFFYLLTGQRPPSASDVNEEGLPVDQLVSRGVSQQAIAAICQAMKSRKRDRLKGATAFVAALSGDTTVSNVIDDTLVEAIVVDEEPTVNVKAEEPKKSVPKKTTTRKPTRRNKRGLYVSKKYRKKLLWWTVGAAALAIVAVIIGVAGRGTDGSLGNSDSSEVTVENTPDKSGKDSVGREYVDLGLPGGVLWATCNVGADKPEDYGKYFAWGETKGYAKGKSHSFDVYNLSYKEDRDLDASHDAATANWGSGWRMPTFQEIEDLVDSRYTTTEWVTENGVEGRKITSKSNGNSIFLPAAGCRYGASLGFEGSSGYYWSCSLDADYSYGAYDLYFSSSSIARSYSYRYIGQSVRAVRVASE